MISITTDEWVAELTKIFAEAKKEGNGDKGLTTNELSAKLGVGRGKVHRMLHLAIEQGHIRVGRRTMTSISGAIYHAVVYCPVDKVKASGKKKK